MNNNVKSASILTVMLAITVSLLVLSVATLIEERSKDKIQLTVTSEQMLPTLRGIQGATGKVLNAYPLDGEEDNAKYWRIEYK